MVYLFIYLFLCLNPQRTAWQRWVTYCPFSLKFLAVLKKINFLGFTYYLFVYLLMLLLLFFGLLLWQNMNVWIHYSQKIQYFLSKGKITRTEYGCHEPLRTRMISFLFFVILMVKQYDFHYFSILIRAINSKIILFWGFVLFVKGVV